jgi:hypothetical protein
MIPKEIEHTKTGRSIHRFICCFTLPFVWNAFAVVAAELSFGTDVNLKFKQWLWKR